MAGSAFKQECPSCEAQVPIRDASLIGKKVACPKCKFSFVVAKPKGGSADDGPVKKIPSNKARPQLPSEDDPGGRPVSPSKKKMFAGLGLAVVGLAILAAGSFYILDKPGGGSKASRTGGQIVKKAPIADPGDTEPKEVAKDEPKVSPVAPKSAERAVVPPGTQLTNLLPPDTEHVFHGFFKDLFDFSSPFRSPVLNQSGSFLENEFKARLGFSPADIDDLIRAERFTDPAWTYTVLHFNDHVDQHAWVKALGLKASPAVNGLTYHQAVKKNAAFEEFGRLAIGVPQVRRTHAPQAEGPTCVFFHDAQTVIVADEGPLQAFLRAGRRFPTRSADEAAPVAKATDKADKVDPEKSEEKKDDKDMAKKDILTDTIWEGRETRPGNFGPIRLTFIVENQVSLETPPGSTLGSYTITKDKVEISFGTNYKYVATLAGGTMTGAGQADNVLWKFSAKRTRTAPTGVAKGGNRKDKAMKLPPVELRTGTYLTIHPSLKAILDRLEGRAADSEEKTLYSMASQAEAARVTNTSTRGKSIWRPRQVWDMTTLFDERTPQRVQRVGSSLIERQTRTYQYRTEFECAQEEDARDLHKRADEMFSTEVARWIERLLGHKILTPQAEALLPPSEEVPEKEVSRWTAALREQSVDIHVDLLLDEPAFKRMQDVTAILALGARGEVDLASDPNLRHRLARAGKELGEKGVGDRQVGPGTFPPGVFKRPGSVTRSANSPYYRLSWLTALLPYLGHDNLSRRIDRDSSWRDPSNWMAAKTLVPEFVDPSYPLSARYVAVPGMGIEPAATHFVGVAGVGLDAADYSRNDPTVRSKLGVLGYDQSATLAEVQKARGTAQTILLLQIPHDGLTGVSPWIAGGGSTLRGVPEKNSIAPFVLSVDRSGKPITHQERQGTFAVMTDGSVRFIDKNIPDQVFKAMCTLHEKASEPEDFFKQAPLVLDPGKSLPTTPAGKVATPKQAASTSPPATAPSTGPEETAPLPKLVNPLPAVPASGKDGKQEAK